MKTGNWKIVWLSRVATGDTICMHQPLWLLLVAIFSKILINAKRWQLMHRQACVGNFTTIFFPCRTDWWCFHYVHRCMVQCEIVLCGKYFCVSSMHVWHNVSVTHLYCRCLMAGMGFFFCDARCILCTMYSRPFPFRQLINLCRCYAYTIWIRNADKLK